MNESQTLHDTMFSSASMIVQNSIAGRDSQRIFDVTTKFLETKLASPHTQAIELAERLFDARAACKKLVATIAMPMLHLSKEWRDRFFVQLDALLNVDDWDNDDLPVTESSFFTLIRMLILLNPKRRPGLGATSDGHIIAVWAKGKNRLTIECLPDDQIRWVVFGYFEGKRETVAGENDLTRLPAVLKPYQPEQWLAGEGPKATP